MTRVSFVVTIYNKALYLPFVVDGLARQRGGFEREFVFVDDGSTDGSVAALQALTAGWSQCRIISQPNAGPSSAMNAGLAVASGDFVKALDGDDMLTPDAVTNLLGAIETTGCGLGFGAGGTYRLEAGLAAARAAADVPSATNAAEILENTLRDCLRRAQTTPSAWLARSELVRRSGGCDTGVFVQDYSIELRLAHLSRFARVPGIVFLAPERAPGRLSERGSQELHDINLALANFVEQTTDLAPSLRRYALKRAAGRARLYGRRHGKRGWLSPSTVRLLAASLGLGTADAAAIRATCRIFRELAAIRLMPSEAAPATSAEPVIS
jgi:glycosyltransferase involved in cell wall biosynthesis